jgi:signal transduction histidine kinase
MVWVGFAENDKEKTVRPVAQAGYEEGYLKTLNITWADTERGRGPTGKAIRTGKPCGCKDMLTDPAFKQWRAEALKRGYASSLVLPLKTADGTFGALTIYSGETNAFSDAETVLLADITDDMAFGVTAIRLRLEHKKAEEVLRRDNETFEKQVKARSRELLDVQQELEKAKRLSDIGTLAAIVAHELRNPLAAISLASSNIRRKAANPLLEKNLNNIDKKITESNQIISNLLFYSRLKLPRYEPVDLRDILKECVNAARTAISREIPVRIELALPKAILMEADPLQMKEVFSNILDNAGDAVSSAPRGKIRIFASGDAGSVTIGIEDSGTGISRDDLGKIFEPFFTTKAKGTGLGLYVCQQIVKLHGGAIAVESEPGKGTVVSVKLPRGPENGGKKHTDY